MQDILVLITIWSAIIYAVYSFVKTFIPKKGKPAHKCTGCSGCSLKTNNQSIIKYPQGNFTIQQ